MAGWAVQDAARVNLRSAVGVAVREMGIRRGFGTADYLLYIEGQADGAVEVKRTGEPFTGVELQAE
jgi:type I restriction enzyme R subunit